MNKIILVLISLILISSIGFTKIYEEQIDHNSDFYEIYIFDDSIKIDKRDNVLASQFVGSRFEPKPLSKEQLKIKELETENTFLRSQLSELQTQITNLINQIGDIINDNKRQDDALCSLKVFGWCLIK